MPARFKISTTVGIVCIVIGLAWLTLWSYSVHRDSVNWIANELRPPLGAKLTTLAGAVILIVTGSLALIGKLTQKISPNNIS